MIAPQSESDLAEAIRGARDPLWIKGGGTRSVQGVGETLSTAGLSGITLYEPGSLTLVAGAGTPLAEIETALAGENQMLSFEPPDLRALLGVGGVPSIGPTIGGVAAANASGPRRIQSGAARDSMIGVRFVDGQGTIVKNGGRVMKNVTGYDLVKLFAGSFGTLGVLSEVAFKVLPATHTMATLVLKGLGAKQAVEAMAMALSSPFEVSGAAFDPDGPEGVAETLIRVEGFEGAVANRSQQLSARLGKICSVSVENDPKAVADRWRQIRDVTPFADQPGDVWRLSVRPSDAPRVLDRLDAERILLDWAGGLVWALVAPGMDVRSALSGVGGHATRVRFDPSEGTQIPRFHPEPAPLRKISDRLRHEFDPRGILNSGLMG